jgi:hypothetical protein
MKISFYISVAASALCLLLSIIIFWVGNVNQSLQAEVQQKQQDLQKQQEQINTARQIQEKVGPALLQDMAQVSLKNEKMKALLAKHGYNVQLNATPAPASGGASAPAPKPSAPASAPAPAANSDSAPALR